MAAPTISATLQTLRRRIASRIGDNIVGTASGGSSVTLTDTGDIARFPTDPQYLKGAELTVINTTNTVTSRHITNHAVSSGTVTLTTPTLDFTPASGHSYEIHNIGGRGFDKSDYDNSINAAIDNIADGYFTDTYSVAFGMQSGGLDGFRRHEYPMPSGYNYIYGVDYLGESASVSNLLTSSYDGTLRAMGDATARTRIWQGFKVLSTGIYGYIALLLEKVGSPTDNISLDIMTDSSGIPSGTNVSKGDSDVIVASTLDAERRWVIFRFDPPVFLVQSTQYHMVLKRSGAVDASNYINWYEDTDAGYGDGTAGTYTSNGSVYTAVSTSDFIFSIFRESSLWIPMTPKLGWRYVRVGTDKIFLGELHGEAIPIRIRGLAAIAEVSAETDTVPIRPEYVEAFAISQLLSGNAGKLLANNTMQQAQTWAQQIMMRPKPMRGLPNNAVRIYA